MKIVTTEISLLSGRWIVPVMLALIGGFAEIGVAESETSAKSLETSSPAWKLKPVERIALVGNTFLERETHYGRIEMSLRLAFPDCDLSVRNLGWSGDNVLGESRAYFGPVSAGYAHLLEYVNLVKPTTVLVSYGHNAAFLPAQEREQFLYDYEKLLTQLQTDDRQVVVLGLTPLEPVHRDAETTAELNQIRGEVNQQIADLCGLRQIPFVDLWSRLPVLQQKFRLSGLTDNGVHLTPTGYVLVGEAVLNSLGKSLQRDETSLLLDSQFAAASEPLATAIAWKNELWFHRFRPQNETYLRGFRKHEQGQNAREIYQFDDLIKQADAKLPALARALSATWLPAD